MIRPMRSALLCLCLLAPLAHAQPTTPVLPTEAAPTTGEEPAPIKPGSPEFLKLSPQQQQEAVMKYSQQEGMRMMRLSPAERQAEMQKLREQIVKQNLTHAGFAQPELQDAVLEFLRAQDKARDDVRRAAKAVYLATEPNGTQRQRGGEAIADQEMLRLINEFEVAGQDEKERREEAEYALDRKIKFSENPRLQAVLMLYGYIGEAAFYVGDSLMGVGVIGTLADVK